MIKAIFLAATLLVSGLLVSGLPAEAGDIQNSRSIIGDLIPFTGDEPAAVDLDVRFRVNSAELTDQARSQLDALGQALTSDRLAGATFQINGHTDASGAAGYNKTLSQARADAVKAYLVDTFAIAPANLTAVGMGEENLKNALTPKASENRRVEIVNLTPPPPAPVPAPVSVPVAPAETAPTPADDGGIQSFN